MANVHRLDHPQSGQALQPIEIPSECFPDHKIDDSVLRLAVDLNRASRMIRHLPVWIRDDFDEAGSKVSEPVDDMLRMIEGQGALMNRRLADLTAFDDLGHHQLRLQAVNPHIALQKLWNLIMPSGPFALHIHGSIAPIQTDPMLFDAIFGALFENAISHHPGGKGRVLARIEAQATGCRISVADNGIGIPPANRQLAFQPFQTFPTDLAEHGTGLGLARVARAVHLLGGEIALSAGLEGRGLTVSVTLPSMLCCPTG